MPCDLRLACSTDLPAVYRGELAYIRCWEPRHEQAWHLDMERHLTRWVDNLERLTVAVADGTVVGYCLWLAEGNAAHLCTLNVNEAFRRQGIGHALLLDYITKAEGQGFTSLALSVREDNPARQLYERVGFIQAGVDSHGYLRYQREGDRR
jgi:ribosomal-protein-alanine N-acetyltransferase